MTRKMFQRLFTPCWASLGLLSVSDRILSRLPFLITLHVIRSRQSVATASHLVLMIQFYYKSFTIAINALRLIYRRSSYILNTCFASIVYITKSSEQGAQTQIFLSASKTINPKTDSGELAKKTLRE